MTMVSVVVGTQLVLLTPTDGLISPTCPADVSVGATAAGADLIEETAGAATEEADGSTAAAEVGAAFSVEGAALLTGAASVDFGGAYALSAAEETAGAALLDEPAWLDSTALLDSAGLLYRIVVDLAADVELGFGVAVVVGFGSEAPFLTGTIFCFSERRAWVTSKAASC